MNGPLNLENPVFTAYLFYSCVLVLKMILMVPLTARQRMAKKVSKPFMVSKSIITPDSWICTLPIKC
jgi:hypothetical protein